MAVSTKNGRYDYPEKNWAEGRMRKKGQRPEGEQYASMVPALRMRPDTRGWGVEIERFAGAGMTARGGSTTRAEVSKGPQGLSPDVIQSRKALTEASGQPWQIGTKYRGKGESKYKPEDIEGIDLWDAVNLTTLPLEMATGKRTSEHVENLFTKVLSWRKSQGSKEIKGFDENLERKTMPIDDYDPAEQANRLMRNMSKQYPSVTFGKKKAEEPKEQEMEE